MKRAALLILLIAMALFAERARNWNGYGDIVNVPACSSTVLVVSDSIFALTDYDAVRIIAQVDDTTSDGFASDSVNIRWGYQTFSLCKNSAGAVDTCYDPRIVVDTISTDSFGVMSVYSTDADGIAASVSRQVDTLHCAGYAIQSRTFSPEWNTYIKVWVEGLTGNLTAAPLKIRFTIVRRIYRGTRGL